MAKRLMIVDDEPDITAVLAEGLKKNGFDVITYNDPAKALSDYEPSSFDLVILDYKMSGIDGFDLYQKMMKIDSGVKYCFLSAAEYLSKDGDTIKPELKSMYFMKKPIAIPDLINQINQILSSP